MHHLVTWISAIDHPVDDMRRRGKIVIGILCSLLVIAVMALLVVLASPAPVVAVTAIGIGIGIFLGLIVVVRRGHVALGGWAVVLVSVVIVLLPPLIERESNQSLAYFLIPVLIAGVLLRPWQTILLVMGLWVLTVGVVWMLPPDPQVMPTRGSIITHAVLLTFISAVIGVVASRVNERALQTRVTGHAQAAQQAQDLATLNHRLTEQVHLRTAELETAVQALQAQTTTQEHLVATQTAQREIIHALSIPVLPIAPQVIVIPLVGVLDRSRIDLLGERALAAIQQYMATQLIVDITGVTVLDQEVAHGIMRVVDAAHFLGTHTILVGVRPEVAHAMVALGLRMGTIETAATIDAGMRRFVQGRYGSRTN